MKVEAIQNESDSRLIVLPDHQRRYIKGPSDSIRDIIAAFYDMTPLKSDFNRGMSCTYNWHAESCLFSHSLVDTVTVQRTKAQAEQGQHLVFVHRIVQGTVRGQLDDLSIDRDPGNIYVFDLSRRVQCLQFPTTVQGIFAPKWMLGYDSAHHAPLISFPTGTTIGHALDTDFNRIFQKLLADNALDKPAFDRFFATLKVGLRTDEQEGDIRKLARDAISQSIQAYIEEHLESPELTIEQLLNNFGVSRASLYRMFDPHGGVRQYISNRRLYRAVLELSE